MARSERFYPPSDAQIRRWEEQAEAKKAFDAQRSRLIESTLRKLRKDDLIELLMGLDTYDPAVRWSIEAEIGLQKPVDLVAHDLRHAIEIATKVDERRANDNFGYSWQAYEEVARGFKLLVRQNELESTKQIAIEFMAKASYQVACSDEGLMAEEIEDCLKPVIEAVANAGGEQAKQWATAMIAADEVGVICDAELTKIAKGK